MPSAVELVAILQVGPTPGGIDHLAPAVQVPVGFLRCGDELDRLLREGFELGRRLTPDLPGERLKPLVDVGVAEHHPPPLAREPSRRDPQVVEGPRALEFLGAAKERHLPVHGLTIGEQPTADDHAAAVNWAQSHACRRRRHHARTDSRNACSHALTPPRAFASTHLAKRFRPYQPQLVVSRRKRFDPLFAGEVSVSTCATRPSRPQAQARLS